LASFGEAGSSLWRSTPSAASATSAGIPRTGEGRGSAAGLVAERWSSADLDAAMAGWEFSSRAHPHTQDVRCFAPDI
jgi:hypothetical protein